MCTLSNYQIILMTLGIGALWVFAILALIYGVEWMGMVFRDDQKP